MNRPANMTPAPGLGPGSTAFRAPYPPSLGSQGGQPAQSPYGPPRTTTNGRSNYLFSGQQLDDPQRQSRTALQQQQAIQQHLQQLSLSQHSQSASASSSSLPLQSAAQGSTQGNPDLRDFPALGSSALNATNALPSTNGNTYATQAGTATQVGTGPLGANSSNSSTGFGPDDFPALGQSQELHSAGPHSLNGSVTTAQDLAAQHRQNLLGSLPTAQQRATPSSEAQQRQLAQQYQNQMLKGFSQKETKNTSSILPPNQYASWNHTQGGSQPSHASLAPDLLGPPPGVGLPVSQGSLQSSTSSQSSHLQTQQVQQPQSDRSSIVTQTPVQQVLASPADRWGLLGLLTMIRSVDPDTAMLGMGTDLSLAGFDLGLQDNLYSSFITPWSDASAAASVEPEFHVPAVYNVHPPVPGPNKAASFSDETLFFMFYSAPRDVLQEVAAQELHNRNWRFHKDIRLWLTKESGTAPSQKASTFERGVYTFFDPETWERVKKETVIMYDLLEEKAPLTVAGPIGGAPGPQGAPTPQSLPPPGMGLLGQGHQLGQQAQGSHLGQSQPQHPNAQHQQQQQQLHQQQQQQQLADQIRMQSMNARYSGARTPGLGGI